ncbi:MAG: T9SS type A sorting domain-containing protein [Bacteroidales bacterium]|nr:T9SS type A sorting domain-containing protein [Bacteroidales bacterium]
MKKHSFIIIILFFIFPVTLSGQRVYSGNVIDTYTKNPIPGAEVLIQGTEIRLTTDELGHFSFTTGLDGISEKADYELKSTNNEIYWYAEWEINFRIYNIVGMETGIEGTSLTGSGVISLAGTDPGIYLLAVTYKGKTRTYKVIKGNDAAIIEGGNSDYHKELKRELKSSKAIQDTLIITKNGYYTQKHACQNTDESYELLKLNYYDIDYLDRIIRPEAYTLLQGLPLNPTFGEVKSIKIVYSIPDGRIYYSNSEKYFIHYDFCAQVLDYDKGHAIFNQEQYTKNVNRIYILASINHFTSSDIYTLDFFAGDELDCSDIETVYNKVAETSYIGNRLRFYANASGWLQCVNVTLISSDELFRGQNYQPLNPTANYGYLKKVAVNDLSGTYLGRHDIVLLNGIPLDISVVAGIITTEFQTPLSHINVLSHNRGTPNMALRDGWTNDKLNDLLNKLVYLKVTLDSFYIREATLQEAQVFWAQREPQIPQLLMLDTTTNGLIDMAAADLNSVSLIGGKAANFAELTRVNVINYGPLPLPEGYFAIPFYYYHHHIKKYGLDVFIENMLQDTVFQTNIAWRQQQLAVLQDSIKNSPLDTGLLRLINDRIATIAGFRNIRFRSSTNAEDIEGFNGAGLYDSFTGILNDNDRPVDRAIKRVWASLWNFRAFEERDYFKIDHKTAAMGILVHRSFPDEAANGVVITKNLYNPYNSAITINVQVGEISVVSPEENYFPDQIIYYTYSDDNIFEYINHSNVPGMEGRTVMTSEELKLLKDYCMAVHYQYCRLFFECRPLDIEFKVDIVNGIRKIYLKQVRLY